MMDVEYIFEYIPFGRSTFQTKTNMKVYTNIGWNLIALEMETERDNFISVALLPPSLIT